MGYEEPQWVSNRRKNRRSCENQVTGGREIPSRETSGSGNQCRGDSEFWRRGRWWTECGFTSVVGFVDPGVPIASPTGRRRKELGERRFLKLEPRWSRGRTVVFRL